MILGSAFCLSTSGVGLRVIEEADGWQILFYRSLSMMALILIVLLLRRPHNLKTRIRALAWDDLALALVLGTGFVAYVFALLQTTVANALFVFSSAPFFAAVLGWIVLRERVAARTWIAIAAAMSGLAIMVSAGMMSGRMSGNLIALWLPISYAVSVVLVRRSQQPDMLLALFLAAGVATLITIPFIDDFSLGWVDLGVSLYLGVFQVGAGFILLILGARYVPAAQVGLLALVEPVLGPVWAWLTVLEMPAQATLVGGAVILAAVGIDAAISAARSSRKSSQSSA
jgi:DME family drug/metabolite transporter|tara:strand:+ start:1062 stop:1916 length:855 start_codon:yes stop_codon:yes gene_type:complete